MPPPFAPNGSKPQGDDQNIRMPTKAAKKKVQSTVGGMLCCFFRKKTCKTAVGSKRSAEHIPLD